MSQAELELRIARAEREYERLTSAAFAAKTQLRTLKANAGSTPLDVARAQANLDTQETKRRQVRALLDALEAQSDADEA